MRVFKLFQSSKKYIFANIFTIEVFIFAKFQQKSNFEQSEFQKLSVTLANVFYLIFFG